MTYTEKQVLKTKICCSCKLEKQISHFYKNCFLPSGYERRCKICKIAKLKCESKGGRPKGENAPQLWNVKKKDWIETYEFLQRMGYSLDRSIHDQFCEKHGLTPRKRKYENSIHYSPKELGMT